MNRLMMILGPALTLAACSTPLPPAPPAPPAPQVAAPVPPSLALSATAPAKPVTVAYTETPMQAFERTDMALANKSIYFDYDKYAIKPTVDTLISQHAKLLESYPQDYLTLQGNCDERGSSEYNLALGQRRADAVKERLVLLGVPAARIETVSFGKEKPRLTCHDEKCWKENRRADFVDIWK